MVVNRLVVGAAALAVALGLWEAAATPPAHPSVLAAASLQAPLRAVAASHVAGGGGRVRLSFGSSGTLAQQLRWGAPADLVILADPRWLPLLEREGLVGPGGVVEIATNGLALAGVLGASPLSAGPPAGRLAMGDPGHVPAGSFAKEALASLGWWEAVAGNAILAPSASDATRMVLVGEADWAVLYQSDAAASGLPWEPLPASLHEPIRYFAFLTPGAGAGAEAFLRALAGERGQEALARHGFGGAAP